MHAIGKGFWYRALRAVLLEYGPRDMLGASRERISPSISRPPMWLVYGFYVSIKMVFVETE